MLYQANAVAAQWEKVSDDRLNAILAEIADVNQKDKALENALDVVITTASFTRWHSLSKPCPSLDAVDIGREGWKVYMNTFLIAHEFLPHYIEV